MDANVCSHNSCVYSSIQGVSNGFTYGAKVRFTHSLVMALLFSKEPYLKRIQRIIHNTLEHGKRLGLFVFIYKSLVCVLNRTRKSNFPGHYFIAGSIASLMVWCDESNISTQITLYLLPRVLAAFVKILYLKSGYKSNFFENNGIFMINVVFMGLSMSLFDYDKTVLQPSMTSTLNTLYIDSNRWKGWIECLTGSLISFKKP